MYDSSVKPLKGSVTRWMYYKTCVMEHVTEKLELYVEGLNSYMVTTKNSTARATVEGKLKKLVEANILLQAAFFTDALA